MLNSLYRRIRKVTAPISQIGSLVPLYSNVLDIGCGRGVVAEEIIQNREPRRYTGIDLNKRNIEYLSKMYPEFSFFNVDAIEYTRECEIKDISYNCIILSDMLYLVDDYQKRELIRNAYKILSDDGIMIIKEAGHNWFLFLQEYISVKILHLTEGEEISLKSAHFYEDILKELSSNYVIINARRLWYPHFIIVVRK